MVDIDMVEMNMVDIDMVDMNIVDMNMVDMDPTPLETLPGPAVLGELFPTLEMPPCQRLLSCLKHPMPFRVHLQLSRHYW